MNQRVAPLLRFVLLVPTSFAQQPPSKKGAAAAPKPQTAAAAKPQGVTLDSVIAMAQAGILDEVITARLRKEDRAFDLSRDDLIRLKKANVIDTVVRIMMDPKAEDSKPAPPAPAPTPAPVVVQAPIVAGLPHVNPSGATPGAGAASTGDPNGPCP